MPAQRRRTLAREIALQYLYGHDLLRGAELQTLDEFLAERTGDPRVLEFARELAGGVLEKREEIDAAIAAAAANWRIDRMAVVDRNVMRLAAYELLFRPDIPPRASLNEAVEMAKRFGSAESGAFVNGILDKIYRSMETKPCPEA